MATAPAWTLGQLLGGYPGLALSALLAMLTTPNNTNTHRRWGMGPGRRGVHQVPMAGGQIVVNLTKADGRIPISLVIDPDDVPPEFRAQILARARRWLDRLDPSLRLVAGDQPRPAPRAPEP